MGCNNSKTKVHVVGAAEPSETHLTGSKLNAKKQKRRKMGSQASLGGESITSDRVGSGTSKTSKHTMDSGFDDPENVITEHSDPRVVKEIEEGFDTPRGLGKTPHLHVYMHVHSPTGLLYFSFSLSLCRPGYHRNTSDATPECKGPREGGGEESVGSSAGRGPHPTTNVARKLRSQFRGLCVSSFTSGVTQLLRLRGGRSSCDQV